MNNLLLPENPELSGFLDSILYESDPENINVSKKILGDYLLDHLEDIPQVLDKIFTWESNIPPTNPNYAKTEFVVEATDFEQMTLHLQHNKTYTDGLPWRQTPIGETINIGTIGGRIIGLHITWIRLNNHLVMFWDFFSNVTDHAMAERWLTKYCNPKYENGSRLARTNAMNFHLCVDYCRT